MTLIHGGDISGASAQFGIDTDDWIDLSTGISPWSWPVPPMPSKIWRTLPDSGDGLEQAAAGCYGCPADSLVATPGSQYALQQVPTLVPCGRVAMPLRGYAEHRLAWQRAGHQLIDYGTLAELQQLVGDKRVDHAVVINPNNPTGETVEAQSLLALREQLVARSGWLLVDEAFVDATPENSLTPHCPLPGLMVLRSLGKFFGLAGVRLGFLIGPQQQIERLRQEMMPWQVSHPARWVGRQALLDVRWQQLQRRRLEEQSRRWMETLRGFFSDLVFVGSPLFVSALGEADYCQSLYRALGQQGMLIRQFEAIGDQAMLRFGLPAEAEREKVLAVLAAVAGGKQCVNG